MAVLLQPDHPEIEWAGIREERFQFLAEREAVRAREPGCDAVHLDREEVRLLEHGQVVVLGHGSYLQAELIGPRVRRYVPE